MIIAIISGVLTFPFQAPFVTVTNLTGTPSVTMAPDPSAGSGD
jgi:hypothetical protein